MFIGEMIITSLLILLFVSAILWLKSKWAVLFLQGQINKLDLLSKGIGESEIVSNRVVKRFITRELLEYVSNIYSLFKVIVFVNNSNSITKQYKQFYKIVFSLSYMVGHDKSYMGSNVEQRTYKLESSIKTFGVKNNFLNG